MMASRGSSESNEVVLQGPHPPHGRHAGRAVDNELMAPILRFPQGLGTTVPFNPVRGTCNDTR